MAIPKGLAARVIIETDSNKSKLYIEVREGNKFSNFYYAYTVMGRGRARIVTPTAPRHRGFADTIEDAAEQIAKAIQAHAKRKKTELQIHTTVRIYRKRLYRKLLAMRPDELGLSIVRPLPDRRTQSRANNHLPVSFIPFAKQQPSITK